MDKAKATMNSFMAKTGHHDTTIDKQAAPAVTHETVRKEQHEQVNTAVNKEVHQDHYHHVVQPVKDKEVLPEKHMHKAADTIHREYDHRDHHAAERAVKKEADKLHDRRVVADTTHTQSQAPVVSGEQTHHHVHEVIQPLVQREVIQPEVVHTTVPIHEVHHEAARHHGTTTLPPVSMGEFKKQVRAMGNDGGVEIFEGCPRGAHSGTVAGGSAARRSSSSSESSLGEHGMKTKKKPSLLDRLNPKTDANGDGKKGFLS